MAHALTARYYVLVSDELMARDDLVMPEGFRFIEQWSADPRNPHAHWWLAEDASADETLNGKRIEPTITRRDDGTTYVSSRRPA